MQLCPSETITLSEEVLFFLYRTDAVITIPGAENDGVALPAPSTSQNFQWISLGFLWNNFILRCYRMLLSYDENMRKY